MVSGTPLVPAVVQRQPFLQGPHPQHRDDLADDLVRRTADLLDVQPVGFDLGQIEDVVDQAEEVVSAGMDGFQVVLALGFARTGCRSLRSRSVKPIIAFSGVRISWLMLARNRLLATLAASAASFAWTSSAWVFSRRAISV